MHLCTFYCSGFLQMGFSWWLMCVGSKIYSSVSPSGRFCIPHILHKLQTKELVSSAPQGHIRPGLVTQPLSQEQWATLDKVNEALTKDYTVRRQMLLTRCDVTIQSFRWCDKAKASINYRACTRYY